MICKASELYLAFGLLQFWWPRLFIGNLWIMKVKILNRKVSLSDSMRHSRGDIILLCNFEKNARVLCTLNPLGRELDPKKYWQSWEFRGDNYFCSYSWPKKNLSSALCAIWKQEPSKYVLFVCLPGALAFRLPMETHKVTDFLENHSPYLFNIVLIVYLSDSKSSNRELLSLIKKKKLQQRGGI